MTEAEWVACTDPRPMLELSLGKLSDRKCRLFACACCRRILPLLSSDEGAKAVEAGELYLEQRASRGELVAAERGAVKARDEEYAAYERSGHRDFRHVVAGSAAVACSWAACRPDGYAGEDYLSCTGVDAANYAAGVRAYHACGTTQDGPDLRRHKQQEYAAQADLLRDIIGNPFRSVAFNPAWRTPTVTALARAAYHDSAGSQSNSCYNPLGCGGLRGKTRIVKAASAVTDMLPERLVSRGFTATFQSRTRAVVLGP